MTFYLKNIKILQLKIIFKLIIFIFFIQKITIETNAQTPTVQDCAGAIPICKNIYNETNSFIGFGNYPNEIDSITCTRTICVETQLLLSRQHTKGAP